jgi:hypothetical protein
MNIGVCHTEPVSADPEYDRLQLQALTSALRQALDAATCMLAESEQGTATARQVLDVRRAVAIVVAMTMNLQPRRRNEGQLRGLVEA